MKQFNRNVLTILLFEGFLGTGTMEWISTWADELKSALWVVFGVYALVLVGFGFLLARMAQNIPSEFAGCTMLDYFLGRKVGGFLNILLMGASLTYASKSLVMGVSLIHYVTLPNTPTLVLVLFALLVPIQLLSARVDALMSFQTVLFWPVLISASTLLFLSLRTSDFSNLLPVVPTTPDVVVSAFPRLAELLPGLMLLLIFLPLFRKHGMPAQDLTRSFILASIGMVVWHLFNLLIVLSVFGPFETSSLQWPVLEVIRLQKIPGIFLERLDLIFLLPMLIGVMSTLNLYAYGSYHVLSYYTKPHQRWGLVSLIVAIVVLSSIPSQFELVSDVYGTIVSVVEWIIFGLIPIMYVFNRMVVRGRHMAK
jgi:hypothetical protein